MIENQEEQEMGGDGEEYSYPWYHWRRWYIWYRMLVPDTAVQVERLQKATVRELEKAKNLQMVLDAKRELLAARAGNTKLRKDIAGTGKRGDRGAAARPVMKPRG